MRFFILSASLLASKVLANNDVQARDVHYEKRALTGGAGGPLDLLSGIESQLLSLFDLGPKPAAAPAPAKGAVSPASPSRALTAPKGASPPRGPLSSAPLPPSSLPPSPPAQALAASSIGTACASPCQILTVTNTVVSCHIEDKPHN